MHQNVCRLHRRQCLLFAPARSEKVCTGESERREGVRAKGLFAWEKRRSPAKLMPLGEAMVAGEVTEAGECERE